MQEIIKTKELVKQVLAEDERARNSDLWLILMVWQKKQQIKIYVPYDQLKEMIKPETITRTRRHIQNMEGLYLPTDENVLKLRTNREFGFANFFGNKNIKRWSDGSFELN